MARPLPTNLGKTAAFRHSPGITPIFTFGADRTSQFQRRFESCWPMDSSQPQPSAKTIHSSNDRLAEVFNEVSNSRLAAPRLFSSAVS